MKKMYKLLTPQGPVQSETPGELGGHINPRGDNLYGRLDCPAALRALRLNGGVKYKKYRVFFKDEATAIACGFRPCRACLRAKYDVWNNMQPKMS